MQPATLSGVVGKTVVDRGLLRKDRGLSIRYVLRPACYSDDGIAVVMGFSGVGKKKLAVYFSNLSK